MAKRFDSTTSHAAGHGRRASALPALEIMLDGKGSLAQATPIPKRYLVCFGGQSLGGDGDPLHNDYVPNTVGAELRSQVGARAAGAR